MIAKHIFVLLFGTQLCSPSHAGDSLIQLQGENSAANLAGTGENGGNGNEDQTDENENQTDGPSNEPPESTGDTSNVDIDDGTSNNGEIVDEGEEDGSGLTAAPEVERWAMPFYDALAQEENAGWYLTMEIIGMCLMFILIAMSNAGGLSGAGSNIPIMLIFFGFTMGEAVPVSAFVAVCATTFRFILNFNQMHPTKPERVCINYEIIMLTMPAVFLGSFIGVFLGTTLDGQDKEVREANKLLAKEDQGTETGEITKVCVYGITVAWSIYTTAKKACEQIEKEKKAESTQKLLEETREGEAAAAVDIADVEKRPTVANTAINDDSAVVDYSAKVTDEKASAAIDQIRYEENNHFTQTKVTFVLINFFTLFSTQVLYGSKAKEPMLPNWARYCVFATFIIVQLGLTQYSIKRQADIQRTKEEAQEQGNYSIDKNDPVFSSMQAIGKLSAFCAIAAVLCGLTGIAGGMVLGPLFLSYNMIAQVMSGTNQFITMVASICVALQYFYLGAANPYYSLLFGCMTLICAYTGIKMVNIYIKKSGKQSVIMIILTICLVLALVSLPIKFVLKQLENDDAAAAEPTEDGAQTELRFDYTSGRDYIF